MKKFKLLPTRGSRLRCAALIAFIAILYIYENFFMHINSSLYSYIIKPFLWLVIAIIIFTFPHMRSKARLRLRRLIMLWSLNFAAIYVIILVLTGLFIDGLGKSPYNHSVTGILVNVFSVSCFLIGRENMRSYLINSVEKKGNHFIFYIISFLMTVSVIPFKKYADIAGFKDVVQFTAQSFVPELCQNLFAAYLVYLGGPIASIIHLGIVQAFYHLSPVLPNLQWITTAFVGVMCPILFFMSMQKIYLLESREGRVKEEDSLLGWGATSVLSILIVWFAVGVFPIYPSVVVTGSMEPMIVPGDVILVHKIKDIDSVKTGEVIQFKRDGVLVSHRVIDIKEIDKVKSYYTKGDNNSGPDTEWVSARDVKGRVIQVVPKIGWPTMLIKSKNINAISNLLNKEGVGSSNRDIEESVMVQKE